MERIRRSLLRVNGRAVLLVWATCVAVAVTSGSGLLRPPALLDDLPALLIRGVGVVGLVYAFVLMHRVGARQAGRRSSAIGPALLRGATLMAVLAVVAGLTPPPREVSDADERGGPRSEDSRPAAPNERGGVRAPPGRAPPPLAETRQGGTGEGTPMPPPSAPGLDGSAPTSAFPDPGPWLRGLLNILALLVLLLGVALVARRRVRARTGPRQFRLETPMPHAPLLPVEPLEPFTRAGRDPREQVTFAYRHLLAELAEARVPRRKQEAPYEYARRATRAIGDVGRPLSRLTRLYVMAQFSEVALQESQGAEAEAALREATDILRRHVALSDPERVTLHAAVSG